MKSLFSIGGVVGLLVLYGCAGRTTNVVPDGEALPEFERRVQAYAQLRDEVEGGAARLRETEKPEKIVAAEQALAAKIAAARPAARRGDVFTPPIRARFKRLLNPQLKGVRGKTTRGIIMDENPGEFPFKINGPYPKEEPLGTVPPNILATLPRLPEDIEYRFIGKHLVLRDARANLIIDFMPNAIS